MTFTEFHTAEQMILDAVAKRGGTRIWLREALWPSFGFDKLSAKNAEHKRKDRL